MRHGSTRPTAERAARRQATTETLFSLGRGATHGGAPAYGSGTGGGTASPERRRGTNERGGTGRRDRPRDGKETAGDNEDYPLARARLERRATYRPTEKRPAAERQDLHGGNGPANGAARVNETGSGTRSVTAGDHEDSPPTRARLQEERSSDQRQRDRCHNSTDTNGDGNRRGPTSRNTLNLLPTAEDRPSDGDRPRRQRR